MPSGARSPETPVQRSSYESATVAPGRRLQLGINTGTDRFQCTAASIQLENSHARCQRCPATILPIVGSGNSTVNRA